MTNRQAFKLKNIVYSALLLVVIFCLAGCSQVNFVTYHNDDGSIHEYVCITISDDVLVQNGYNIDNVHFEIKHNSYIQAQQLRDDYREKLYTNYSHGLISNEQYTKLYNGINIIEQDWNNGTYIIGLSYADSACYKSYYNILNGATFSDNQVKKLFYTKTYYRGVVGFGDYTIFNSIYSYYANTVFHKIAPQNNTLLYSYSVPSRRYHSDADKVTIDSNGNYIHSWIVDADEPNQKIYFYTISANKSVWIIASVVIGLAVCLILCIIGMFKHKHNASDNTNSDNIAEKELTNSSNDAIIDEDVESSTNS